eukprot:3044910-Prymnesium_polylepis.1
MVLQFALSADMRSLVWPMVSDRAWGATRRMQPALSFNCRSARRRAALPIPKVAIGRTSELQLARCPSLWSTYLLPTHTWGRCTCPEIFQKFAMAESKTKFLKIYVLWTIRDPSLSPRTMSRA